MTRIQTSKEISKKLYAFSVGRQSNPGEMYGLPWAWHRLNSISGGMKLEDFVIFAARPGKGKTSFMCQEALHVARWLLDHDSDAVVRLVLCESSAEMMQMRMATMMTGISQTRIKQGRLNSIEEGDYSQALAYLASLPIEYLDPLSLDHSRRFIMEGRESSSGPKGRQTAWFAVDYLQIHPFMPDKESSLYYSTTKLSNGFRDLALHVAPGLVLSQMSRSIERSDRKDKTPQLSDLRESGAIEQDASMVIIPIRDDDFVAMPDEFTGEPVPGKFRILKHRNGPLGSVPFEWMPRTMLFKDRSDEWSEGDVPA